MFLLSVPVNGSKPVRVFLISGCNNRQNIHHNVWSVNVTLLKDENATEISRTEPHRFLYLIRSNPYFLVRLYRFRFRIWDVSYFKCKSRKRFTHFSTVFYFSTFNLKYSEFKIRFKPNLANCTGHTTQLQAAHHAAAFFLLVASCPLL